MYLNTAKNTSLKLFITRGRRNYVQWWTYCDYHFSVYTNTESLFVPGSSTWICQLRLSQKKKFKTLVVCVYSYGNRSLLVHETYTIGSGILSTSCWGRYCYEYHYFIHFMDDELEVQRVYSHWHKNSDSLTLTHILYSPYFSFVTNSMLQDCKIAVHSSTPHPPSKFCIPILSPVRNYYHNFHILEIVSLRLLFFFQVHVY